MNLVPWKNKTEGNGGTFRPETSLANFRQEFDELFSRFLGGPGLGWNWPASFGPRMDVAETDRDVTVTAELPGVDPKDIDIQVTGNQLTIRGEKKQDREHKSRDYCCTERQFGSFQRSIQLPGIVDPDNVKAAYKDGVLTVTIGKHPQAQPKRIAVKSGS